MLPLKVGFCRRIYAKLSSAGSDGDDDEDDHTEDDDAAADDADELETFLQEEAEGFAVELAGEDMRNMLYLIYRGLDEHSESNDDHADDTSYMLQLKLSDHAKHLWCMQQPWSHMSLMLYAGMP